MMEKCSLCSTKPVTPCARDQQSVLVSQLGFVFIHLDKLGFPLFVMMWRDRWNSFVVRFQNEWQLDEMDSIARV